LKISSFHEDFQLFSFAIRCVPRLFSGFDFVFVFAFDLSFPYFFSVTPCCKPAVVGLRAASPPWWAASPLWWVSVVNAGFGCGLTTESF